MVSSRFFLLGVSYFLVLHIGVSLLVNPLQLLLKPAATGIEEQS
jgi:hypothetical protein